MSSSSTLPFFFFACAAFIAARAAVSLVPAQAPGEPDPVKAVNGLPEPIPPNHEFLEQCAKEMSAECSEAVYDAVFKVAGAAGSKTVSGECCGELVAMGKECHGRLVGAISDIPELAEKGSEAKERSVKVWNECAALIHRENAPSPSP